jgi:predicted RNA-binding Zn ribbon-like protein
LAIKLLPVRLFTAYDQQLMPGLLPPLQLAGDLGLQFVNSLDSRGSDEPRELLADYQALLAWANRVGALSGNDAARLERAARARPLVAREVHRRAVALREGLHQLFVAHLLGHRPRSRDLALVSAELALLGAEAELEHGPAGYRLVWAARDRLEEVLWAPARAAVALLGSPSLERVRECPGVDGCGRLFLDSTKNGSRHWCDTATCGTRAKGRRRSGG